MKAHELRELFNEDTLIATLGAKVRARWSAGSFGHYSAAATVVKVNAKSLRCKLDESILKDVYDRSTRTFGKGEVLYPVGRLITVPRFTVETLTDGRWGNLNGASIDATRTLGTDRPLTAEDRKFIGDFAAKT